MKILSFVVGVLTAFSTSAQGTRIAHGPPKDFVRPSQPPIAGEIVFFMTSGRVSGPFEIRISSDGRANVAWKRNDTQMRKPFVLTGDELALLKKEIRDAKFFNFKLKSGMPRMHCADSVLRVSMNKQKRTVRSCGDPNLDRLLAFFYKLYSQADLVASIEADMKIYEALGALDSNLASSKIIQPRVLRGPLMAFVRRCSDRSKLEYALSGLTYLMTPKEWAEFLSEELAKADESRRLSLMETITFSGHLPSRPRGYTKAALPILFREIQRDYLEYASFPRPKIGTYAFTAMKLCEWRYPPVAPLLIKAIKDSDGHHEPPPGIDGLGSMLYVVIDDVEVMLDHPKPHIRRFAASQLTRMWSLLQTYRTDLPPPVGGLGIAKPTQPLQEHQKKALESQLIRIASTKLSKMAVSDPDEGVRRPATGGAKWIGRKWNIDQFHHWPIEYY